jgi:hypothetical protein
MVVSVRVKTRQYKAISRSTRKQIHPRKRRVSVTTEEITVAKTVGNPLSRCRLLMPWLEMARLAPTERDDDVSLIPLELYTLLDNAKNSASFPAERLRQWFYSWPNRVDARDRLWRLSDAVADTFRYVAGETSNELVEDEGPIFGVGFSMPEGRFHYDDFDPYRSHFLAAMRDLERGRIGRCSNCRRLYFRLRYKTGSEKANSKACSKSCNTARRQRDWRKKQERYNQDRKFRDAGLTPSTMTKRTGRR